MNTASPSTRSLLSLSLLAAPLFYLLVDIMYASRGWNDGFAANLHIVGAIFYGAAALALVALSLGRWQTALLIVAVIGMIGNADVGVDTLHMSLGAQSLFDSDAGTTVLFKIHPFFFPLTFAIAAFIVRGNVPTWNRVLLLVGALLFPIAHISETDWLAITDAIIMVAALGGIWLATRSAFVEDVQ